MPVRRFAISAAVLGLLVGVALTWPLVLNLDSTLLEDGTLDAFQFSWNLWWVRESLLALRTHPFWTNYLYHPDGVPLLFHTGSFALGLASLPLQLFAGVVTAHNALVITAPALVLVAVATLAYQATGDAWAALVAGLLGAITPFAIWVLPVIYLSCGWIPPALLALWWAVQRERRWTLVGAALALLAFSVFASQEYAMLAVALVGLDVMLRLALAERLELQRLWPRGSAVFLGLAACFLGGLAAIAAQTPAQPPPAAHTMLFSGWALAFVTPAWLAEPLFPFARVYYLGTATLALSALGLVLAPRRAAYWALVSLPLLAMVLGPVLTLAGGPDGLPGPYTILGSVFPLLRFLRSPYRWLAAAAPMLAVLAGVGAAALRGRLPAGGWRAAATGVLLAIAAGTAAFESVPLRAPLASAQLPPAYEVVVNDPQPCALLDLPSGSTGSFALLSSRYMFYQTAHRKYLLEGTVSRLPPGRARFVGRRVVDFATLPYLKYVVVHRELLDQVDPASRVWTQGLASLAQRQGRLVARDAATEVYELYTFRAATVRSHGAPGAGSPGR